MPLPAGTKLGPYVIQELLGTGGMGEVYRASDSRLGREVAVKVLLASLSPDEEHLQRFAQEAHAVAALNHPNILAIFDTGSHDGSPYLVSELLEGETLRKKLAAGPIPPRKAVDYASQIANGLAAAHERGVIHRDLKPENIFVTRDGRAKILDFGLAKLRLREAPAGEAGTQPTQSVTRPDAVVGTPAYMSPEQVRGGAIDARTDIFSLGVVLSEMLSGQSPFRCDSAVETMNAILKEEPLEPKAATAAMGHIVQH
jgi:eukaryotic-like serine/threonine-protein kinase